MQTFADVLQWIDELFSALETLLLPGPEGPDPLQMVIWTYVAISLLKMVWRFIYEQIEEYQAERFYQEVRAEREREQREQRKPVKARARRSTRRRRRRA